jgi:hypothetical protein
VIARKHETYSSPWGSGMTLSITEDFQLVTDDSCDLPNVPPGPLVTCA